jgi:mannitol/fructose-specific phosphotransferase system IIA component (Ntr-type)
VNVLRFLRPACIQLPLVTQPVPLPDDPEEETPGQVAKRLAKEKGLVMEELAGVLARCEDVVNPTKLLRDLEHRERNATTAIGNGVAIPHVRTLQARSFIMGFARAAGEGLAYGAADGEPVRLFFLMAAPPYDDRVYHQVHREVATILTDDDLVDDLLRAEAPQDVFNLLRRFFA